MAERGEDDERPPDSLLPPLSTGPEKSGLALSVLALAAFAGAAYLSHPLWMGMAVGTVMAFTSDPLYGWLLPKFRNRRAIAALVTTVIGGIASLAVLGTVTYVAVTETIELIGKLRLPSSEDLLGERGRAVLERAHIKPEALVDSLNSALLSVSEKAAGGVASVLSTTTTMILTVVIAFFTMYYVLLEWPALVRRLQRILPLDPRHTRVLAQEFRTVGRSAFIGTMGTSLVQGIFAAVGYSIAGISQPLLWGTVTMLASFLPVVGTAAVWFPSVIVCFMTGNAGAAVFLFIWGVLIITGVSDYVIRPRLVGSEGHVHPLPLLVSLLGGVEMFGLMGVIVGPIMMSLCLAIIRIYEQERGRDEPRTSLPTGVDRGSTPP